MPKDNRYGIVKKVINKGGITTFLEVLEILPKTVIQKDLKMHHETFNKIIEDKERFTLKDIGRLASLIEVDSWEIAKIIFNDIAIGKTSEMKEK